MKRQWTVEEINVWYDKMPWLTGSNFLPSNVINRLDMWQSYGRDEHLERAEKELAFAESLGFNSIRIWANFDVYYKEPEEFMKTLDAYIELARKYHQSVMMVLAYEEDLPFGDKFIAKELGPQKLRYNHFNRDYTFEAEHDKLGDFKHYMEYPELRPIFEEMVKRIVLKYRTDNVICAWNVVNEPGIKIHDRAVCLLDDLFALVRSLDPIQPLTADVWSGINQDGCRQSNAENRAFELSDFISFHSYSPFEWFKKNVMIAKSWGRPVIVTEWLNRANHNNFVDCYPFLAENKIGSYFWGFVQGLTYTTEPWESVFNTFENGQESTMDITKWQHELFRTSLRPYDYAEYNVLREVNKLRIH